MINKVYYVIISCEIWTPANIDSQKIIFTSKYLCDVDMDIRLDLAFLTVILRFITLSYFDEFDSDFNDNRSLKPRGYEEDTCLYKAVKWNKVHVFDVRKCSGNHACRLACLPGSAPAASFRPHSSKLCEASMS